MSTTVITIIVSSFLFILLLRMMMRKKSENQHFDVSNIGTEMRSTTSSVKGGINSDKNVKGKRRPFIALVAFALVGILPIFFLTKGCTSDYLTVTFAVEENGKKYLFSRSEFLVENAIKKNEVPPSLSSNIIYIIEEEVYMKPSDIDQVVNILSGNYKLIEKQEPSYNGYAVEDSVEVFNKRTQNKAGKKIGETEIIQIATISRPPSLKSTMEIKWKTAPSLEAISNCSIEDIWVVTNPHPGTTVGNWEEDVLVNIETINKFFSNSFEIVYIEEDAVVYFKKVR